MSVRLIMIQKKRGLLITIALLLALIIVLTACSKIPRTTDNPFVDFENNKYYQGMQGVEMMFQPGMPPTKIFYYGTGYDNSFDVNVEVANIGSSWSRGGLFLSGYDPNMIQVNGINPLRNTGQACQIDIGNIGFGEFGGALRCENFFIGGGQSGTFEFGIQNLFGSGGSYSNRFDLGKLLSGIDIYHRESAGGTNQWSIGFNNPGLDIEYANHGRLLITLFQGLDFARNFGLEYLLEGDTYEYPGGEIDYINFDGNIVNWPPGLDYTYTTFMVTNCFLYATYAAPVVCIDPAPFSDDRKVCYPKKFTGTKGQGAPVAVTYIEQENTPRQAIFTIHIRNVGGGDVYDPGRLEKCSPYFPGRVTNEDKNIIYIGDIRVSGDLQRLECTPNDYVRLDPTTREAIVTCSYNIPFAGVRSAYQSPLVVELWYGYSKTMTRRVLIKRAT
jgi:hypothetical protein